LHRWRRISRLDRPALAVKEHLLLADIVAKRFLVPERGIIFQERVRIAGKGQHESLQRHRFVHRELPAKDAGTSEENASGHFQNCAASDRGGVPTYKLNGNLVHFGGFKSHIGFFPTPSGIKHFQKELSAYKTSKGAVQFPIEKPIAVGLGQIVE
jgi:hypothetical protein